MVSRKLLRPLVLIGTLIYVIGVVLSTSPSSAVIMLLISCIVGIGASMTFRLFGHVTGRTNGGEKKG